MRYFTLLLFIFLFVNFSFSQDKAKSDTVKTSIYDAKSDPAKELSKAVKTASKKDKRILLQVGGDWCPWCKKLDKLFKENEEIASLLDKHYILLKVNYSKENKNEKFLSKYPKIEGYPHIFVLDKNGKFIHSQNTGDLETGEYHDPAKVIAFLEKWIKTK